MKYLAIYKQLYKYGYANRFWLRLIKQNIFLLKFTWMGEPEVQGSPQWPLWCYQGNMNASGPMTKRCHWSPTSRSDWAFLNNVRCPGHRNLRWCHEASLGRHILCSSDVWWSLAQPETEREKHVTDDTEHKTDTKTQFSWVRIALWQTDGTADNL